MINDLDRTIRTLLKQEMSGEYSIEEDPEDPPSASEAHNGDGQSSIKTEVIISFDKPDKDWAGTLGKPNVNLFLYDIRENLQLRSNEQYLSRNGTSGTTSFSPTRIDFTYLISVWTNKNGDSSGHIKEEHRILGNVLTALLRYPILPQELLQGAIRDQSQIPGAQLPRAWIAQPEDTPKTWEFWGSNEWRLKAGISYRVTLYIQPAPVEVNLVTQTEIQLQLEQQISPQ
jgi:Pvc16 N-terminal domain